MFKDPYLVLGISKDSSQSEIENAYNRLKAHYTDQLFEEGEAGKMAGRKLEELDKAYQECLDNSQNNFYYNTYGSNYTNIENLIKENKLEDAQQKLDSIESRDAEWHYLQAVIYHKKNWLVESKNQLEIAVNLDPSNDKYARSLQKMNEFIASKTSSQHKEDFANQQTNNRAGYSRPTYNTSNNSQACCNTCNTLICCDCCCECMGGDLIPCC